MADIFLPLAVLVILILAVLVLVLFRQNHFPRQQIEGLVFQKTSQSVKYGKLTEQFIPFTQDFPFDVQQFRFIGNPIDGIVFDEDSIYFCEFKTASSQLNARQKKVKELVEEKKVKWVEFRRR